MSPQRPSTTNGAVTWSRSQNLSNMLRWWRTTHCEQPLRSRRNKKFSPGFIDMLLMSRTNWFLMQICLKILNMINIHESVNSQFIFILTCVIRPTKVAGCRKHFKSTFLSIAETTWICGKLEVWFCVITL